jgi:hypothetical protein
MPHGGQDIHDCLDGAKSAFPGPACTALVIDLACFDLAQEGCGRDHGCHSAASGKDASAAERGLGNH